MPELRWLILVAGAAFVAALWFTARRQERRRQQRRRERLEPQLDGTTAVGTAGRWEEEDDNRREPAFFQGDEAERQLAFDDELGFPPVGDDVSAGDASSASQGRGGAASAPRYEDSVAPAYLRRRADRERRGESERGTRELPIVNVGAPGVREAPATARERQPRRRPDPGTPAGEAATAAAAGAATARPKAGSGAGGRERAGDRRGADAAAETPAAAQAPSPAASATQPASGATQPAPAPDFEEIIELRLVPRGRDAFEGDHVEQGLITAGLQRGYFDIFHYAPPGVSAPVYSIANLVEPGTLREEDLAGRHLPGLTVFMQLPGPLPGVPALQEMITGARLLANFLEGEVLDDTGGSLTPQTEEHLRERIVAFEHRRARAER